jgi:hypothetical protein
MIALHPGRGVAGHAVLEAREPQQDEPQVVVAGLLDHAVQQGEVEASFLGLDHVPIHGHEDRVQVQVGEPAPERLQIRRVRRRGVAQLTGPHEERLPADDQLRRRALAPQVRKRGIGIGSVAGRGNGEEQEAWDDAGSHGCG